MARAENLVVVAAGRFLNSFKAPAHLLVAVSGGSDSTGLLVALATLCATGRYPGIGLSACTIDHDLRPGSAREAAWVSALCARYGIPHITRRWEGEKPVSGLQAAARAKRYDLLADAALVAGADAILTAHTLDDQAETVAMRAERAPEGVGLSGMADAVLLNGSIWLLRPFLALDRAAIRAFLADEGEGWLDDPSNVNPRFERVRMRQRRAPAEPQPAAAQRLSLSKRAADFLVANVERDGALFQIQSVAAALADPAAWRGFLVLAAMVGGRIHVPDAASSARLRLFLASGTLSRLTAGRVVFDRRRDGLFLYREYRDLKSLALPPGAAAVWDSRYSIRNLADRAIVIGAGSENGLGDGGLRGPARRASRAVPRLTFEHGGIAPGEAAAIAPLIAPYARFLPRFDLPIADALARILDLPPFSSPPNE